MSYDEHDAWQEEAQARYEKDVIDNYLENNAYELYGEHYEQAVKEFKQERLKSYYLEHPDAARPALIMMEEATRLRKEHQHASMLFCVSTVDIVIRHLLAKPILNGLVHNEAIADLVTDLIPSSGTDSFKTLLFGILRKVADIDLATLKRTGSERRLWDEWKALQRDRNSLIHSGVAPSVESIELSEPVALEFLNVVFPKVLEKLGLIVNGYLLIENPM